MSGCVQELIPQVQSETRIFEQIHILAVAGLRNVDWTAVTVSRPQLLGPASALLLHLCNCIYCISFCAAARVTLCVQKRYCA